MVQNVYNVLKEFNGCNFKYSIEFNNFNLLLKFLYNLKFLRESTLIKNEIDTLFSTPLEYIGLLSKKLKSSFYEFHFEFEGFKYSVFLNKNICILLASENNIFSIQGKLLELSSVLGDDYNLICQLDFEFLDITDKLKHIEYHISEESNITDYKLLYWDDSLSLLQTLGLDSSNIKTISKYTFGGKPGILHIGSDEFKIKKKNIYNYLFTQDFNISKESFSIKLLFEVEFLEYILSGYIYDDRGARFYLG